MKKKEKNRGKFFSPPLVATQNYLKIFCQKTQQAVKFLHYRDKVSTESTISCTFVISYYNKITKEFISQPLSKIRISQKIDRPKYTFVSFVAFPHTQSKTVPPTFARFTEASLCWIMYSESLVAQLFVFCMKSGSFSCTVASQ